MKPRKLLLLSLGKVKKDLEAGDKESKSPSHFAARSVA